LPSLCSTPGDNGLRPVKPLEKYLEMGAGTATANLLKFVNKPIPLMTNREDFETGLFMNTNLVA
jgi:hypothetical protein